VGISEVNENDKYDISAELKQAYKSNRNSEKKRSKENSESDCYTFCSERDSKNNRHSCYHSQQSTSARGS